MKIKIYADGANLEEMKAALRTDSVAGFTTNPTLMKKAGVTDYLKFAVDSLHHIKDKPISFEVFSDDFEEMYVQARKLADLGDNVYVKIPVTNTKGQFSGELIKRLDSENIKMNVTAVFTLNQVHAILKNLLSDTPHIISIFAGRIADTGVDPLPLMMTALEVIKNRNSHLQLLWASPREVLNVYQADQVGCDIITVTSQLLNKLSLYNKPLSEFSRETVQMFFDDAASSGFTL